MSDLAGLYIPGRGRRTDRRTAPATLPTGATLGTHSDVVWEGLCADLAWVDYLAGRIDRATYLAAKATYTAALDNHLTLTLVAAGYPPASGGRKVRGY